MIKLLYRFLFIFLLLGCTKKNSSLPNGFVFLTDIDSSIVESARYFRNENFIGKAVTGYKIKRVICTEKAAHALKLANTELKTQGYKLVVYDGYRPQKAVNEFISWSENIQDQISKKYYYPAIDKKDVFKLGYVAKQSSHSRGSTFDLTMIEYNKYLKPILYSKRILNNGEEIPFLDDNTIDMGSSFDLFHMVSHHDTDLISVTHTNYRNILRNVMKKYGFKEYKQEWWHYTLSNEPYPNTYFNFIAQ